jgi:uncharacterized surface protein with fasciclin (FAS1) repeats
MIASYHRAQLVPEECSLYFRFTMKSRFRSRWLLPALMLGLMAAQAEAKTAKIRDLADTVATNPILTKFAAMIQASDLGTFLSSRGPFTLFVPTDSAFSKLPPGMLDTLLRPENKVRLQDILLFHVVNGKRLTAKDLLPLKTVLSCQGTPLPLRTSHSGTQFVMKAKIVHADIKCQNGVINEIDTVLMPPEASLPPVSSPPSPTPATNAAPAATNAPSSTTNTAPIDANASPVVPAAPVATPSAMAR